MRVTFSACPIGHVSRLSRCRAAIAPSAPGIGIPVRIVRRAAQHLVDSLDQPFGDDVLELFGFFVHLGPAHPHHLHEKCFDETVTPQHEARELLAGRRQPHARNTARTRPAPIRPAP